MVPTRAGKSLTPPTALSSPTPGHATDTPGSSTTSSTEDQRPLGLPRRRKRSDSPSNGENTERPPPQRTRLISPSYSPRLHLDTGASGLVQYGQPPQLVQSMLSVSPMPTGTPNAIAILGEPAEARQFMENFLAQAAAPENSVIFTEHFDEARRNGLASVTISSTYQTSAATHFDPETGVQNIVINPFHVEPGSPPDFVQTVAGVQSNIRSALLFEIINAARHPYFADIEQRAENGDIDADAEEMIIGPGEAALLEQGHSRPAVCYASKIEQAEHESGIQAYQATRELVAAGVIPPDAPELHDLALSAAASFPDFLLVMVQKGHTQKYIVQFDEYVHEDELRTPTEDDFR